MAFKTDVRRLFPFLLLFIDSALAYYCDNGKCSEEEYCCGENMCCKSYKVWDMWYFWSGFLFFISLMSVCTCLWRCGFFRNGPAFLNTYTYSPLQRVDTEPTSQVSVGAGPFHFHSNSQVYAAPLGTPPPYNQVSASAVKASEPPPSYAQVIGVGDFR